MVLGPLRVAMRCRDPLHARQGGILRASGPPRHRLTSPLPAAISEGCQSRGRFTPGWPDLLTN